MVKAHAFHGMYGCGGPDAYAWLRQFERVNQVAYTWFEYFVPEDVDLKSLTEQFAASAPKTMYRPWNRDLTPEERDIDLRLIESHLHHLRHEFRSVTDQEFRFSLGWAYVTTASYESVLKEMRFLLRSYPDYQPALGLGSEVMVGWKAGSLKFEGDEYLTGFKETPLNASDRPPDIQQVAEVARRLGISPRIANVHAQLGKALEKRLQTREAMLQYRVAQQFRQR
jgi:hypothetical protein